MPSLKQASNPTSAPYASMGCQWNNWYWILVLDIFTFAHFHSRPYAPYASCGVNCDHEDPRPATRNPGGASRSSVLAVVQAGVESDFRSLRFNDSGKQLADRCQCLHDVARPPRPCRKVAAEPRLAVSLSALASLGLARYKREPRLRGGYARRLSPLPRVLSMIRFHCAP